MSDEGLSREGVALLLRVFAEGTGHLLNVPDVDYIPPVAIENDDALQKPLREIVALGLGEQHPNPDPATNDASPTLLYLSNKAIAWCCWFFFRKHWGNLKALDGSTTMYTYLERLCERELSA